MANRPKKPLSRRRFLRGLTAGITTTGAAGLLAACGETTTPAAEVPANNVAPAAAQAPPANFKHHNCPWCNTRL